MSESEPEPSQKRASLTNILLATGLAAAVGLLGAAGAGYLLYAHVTEPRPASDWAEFRVPSGATGRQVGRLLAQEGYVEHELLFRAAMRLEPSTTHIKAGKYSLPRGVSASQLLRELREQTPIPEIDATAVKVTIPEGLTIRQMAEHLSFGQAFVDAADKIAALEPLPFPTPSLEGYLMPNTYYFAEPPTAEAVVRRMLEQFETEFARLREEHPTADPVRAVTVASLVEEEARVDAERPLIASVIYNRLERDRPLEMDSTLQYALDKYGQRLLNEDKEVDSPYNTYRRAGLPPGPIANPGAASLAAALDPAETDFLYFVSNADGKTHTFSRTLAEHNEAVAKYRREIRKQRRALQESQ